MKASTSASIDAEMQRVIIAYLTGPSSGAHPASLGDGVNFALPKSGLYRCT